MYTLKQKQAQLFSDFIVEWSKIGNKFHIPTKEKKHVLFQALFPSCRCEFSNFQDYPYDKLINEIISKEACHKAFNETLAHMNPNSIQTHVSLEKPKHIHHHNPRVKMIACFSHDDIEFWQPRKSCRQYIKFHEDISEVLDSLVHMNLVSYLPIKKPPRIKPQGYQAHLFCNFHRRSDHATKECCHLRNIIHNLYEKGKFKFYHEVSDDVLQ